MAELDSLWVGSTADRKVGTEDARRGLNTLLVPGTSAINARSGIRPMAGNPGLVAATGTPGPDVTVNAFQAVLDLAARPGAYIATLDATKTVAILDVPADPTNQRNDLIIAQQNDADYGDANRNYQIVRVQGTPSGSPADPSVPGSQNYIRLARVRVTAAATTITNAMIDDLRPGWIAAMGGILLINSSTDRATLTPYASMAIFRLDRNWVEVYDTAWRVQDIAVCSSTADRDSAITSPYNGQLAYTSDTGKVWQRHGGAWREWPSGKMAQLRQTVTQTLTTGVFADVTFSTEDWDVFTEHDTVTNNARYTAGFAGVREFAGGVTFAAASAGARILQWAKNGTAVNGSDVAIASAGGGLATRVAARTVEVDMAAGDYVTLQALQDTGGNLATISSGAAMSSMTVKYVGG